MRRLKLRIVCALLVVLGALTGPQPALGDEGQAAALFDQGNALRRQHRYSEALVKYEAAYALLPTFKIDYNIALTLEKMDRLTEAAERYERFLDKGQGQSPPQMVSFATLKLEALRKQLARLVIRGRPGTQVQVDGQDRGKTPFQWPLYLTPGSHLVRLLVPGQTPQVEEVRFEAGIRVEIMAGFKPSAPDAPPGPQGPASMGPRAWSETPSRPDKAAALGEQTQVRRRQTIIGYTSLGLALACGATAALLYGLGQTQGSSAFDRYLEATSQEDMDRHWEDVERSEKLFIGGHVLAGVGAAALGVAIWQLVTRPSESPAGPTGRALLLPSARGATLSFEGSF